MKYKLTANTNIIDVLVHGRSLSLTDKGREEEHGDGDVEDGRGNIQEPVGCHGKEAQEEQEEEQTAPVFLNLIHLYTDRKRQRKKSLKKSTIRKPLGAIKAHAD